VSLVFFRAPASSARRGANENQHSYSGSTIFLTLFQNIAPKKGGANCAIITKDTKPMETNVYSKAKFYRWHKIISKKYLFFYYLRSVYYFFLKNF
jgi:hypothetical protein